MSLVALRSVINCFSNGKISDTIIFFSSSSFCLILCLYSRCLLHITQFTCRLAAHLALSLIHSLSIHCTRHPSTLSLRIHTESAHGTMTVCSLGRSPAFFWSFMWCHERIEKISHCSGPTHKYINTYEIFIFCAPQIRIYTMRTSCFLTFCACIHNSPSGYKKTAQKQNDNDDEKKKKWSQQGNVLRHFAFLKRIKNSISHKTIFGYSLCAPFACSRAHVCCITICGVYVCVGHVWAFFFTFHFFDFHLAAKKKCFANMLSNVRALDIFDVFFLFYFFSYFSHCSLFVLDYYLFYGSAESVCAVSFHRWCAWAGWQMTEEKTLIESNRRQRAARKICLFDHIILLGSRRET